ncbi:hypothetical protein, partial [Chroococcus sp. FPU101]|uniref:hypothetical protein n=1 Tax=Chroococcus sp. FPU101 TaxID=1974212 RepID=UPI001A8CA827
MPTSPRGEKTEQVTQPTNKSNTILSKANLTSDLSRTTSLTSPKRSRSLVGERIEQAIAFVMQHNLIPSCEL